MAGGEDGNNANGNGVASSSRGFQPLVLDSPTDVDRRVTERPVGGPGGLVTGIIIFLLNETDLRLPSDIMRRKTTGGGILRILRLVRRVGEVPALLGDALFSLRPDHDCLRAVWR
jgi:hypothetical protein